MVVLRGAGGRAFASGGDLAESGEMDERAARIHFCEFERCLSAIERTPLPVIAMIDGYCLAGGLELAQMCDVRYCSDASRFGVVETRFSAGIVTLAMPWIIGPRCRELIYSGDTFDAEEAFRLGLVDRVFEQQRLRSETMKRAKRMSQVALACLRYNKRAINNTYESMGFNSAMRYGVAIATLSDSTATPEFVEFDRVRREQGFKAALRWRDEQFKRYE